MEWGTTEFEEEEEDRPDFQGDKVRSVVNGKYQKYFPPGKRSMLVLFSTCVVTPAILVVIGIVGVVFYTQVVIANDVRNPSTQSGASTAVSIVNAVQIQVLNYLYSSLADYLTRRENHRTDTAHEDSLIAKLFAFNFVNSYASLFYVAFIKAYVGTSCLQSCMNELSTNLSIIFSECFVLCLVSHPFALIPSPRSHQAHHHQGAVLPHLVCVSSFE